MCRGKGSAVQSLPALQGTGWIEILGAGMVHPRLFELAGYSEDYEQGLTGFAFGMGIERIAMLLHGVPDLRLMVSGRLALSRGQFLRMKCEFLGIGFPRWWI